MKTKVEIIVVLFCTVLMFSSCVTTQQINLLQEIEKNYPPTSPEEYRIIPGDQLAISIYALDKETEEIFKEYTPSFTWDVANDNTTMAEGQMRNLGVKEAIKPLSVYADGTINLPYLGKIYVEGSTILEVRNAISTKLNAFSEGTSADIVLYNRYFSILGEAGARRITMDYNKVTIYQALATANTIGPYGDRTKVSILRQTKNGSIVKTFDLRTKDIVDTEFYYIQPNDVIYIPQTSRKFLGATNSFAGLFGLITSIAGVVVFIFRII